MKRIALSAPSDDSVTIEIGGIAIALQTHDATLKDLLRARYAGFIGASSDTRCHFNVELSEFQPGNHRLDPDADLEVRTKPGLWMFKRGDFQAQWNPETGAGKIFQSLNPYAPDAVLRIVHTLILARSGGFLLHAASAIRNGRAFIFSGVSGAGKTTISGLAPTDVTLLTDEISYIKPDGDNYRAFGTPFAGELGKAGENTSAPVSTLFFLAKGPDNRIEPLPTGEAVRLLLRNILFFANDSELVKLVFQSACRFMEKIPVRRLVFVPDDQVWEIIRSP